MPFRYAGHYIASQLNSSLAGQHQGYINEQVKEFGGKALVFVEDIGLLVIAVSTVVAMSLEISAMFRAINVTLADLLLLFIYL